MNILKFNGRNGRAAVAVLARFTGMFLSDLCLVQKRMFYTRTGRTACVYVERARVRVTVRHECASVCLSACFCGGNPRTVPQLSLNDKFRAPLGYRGLVLGLNVSSFVLWVFPMEHVQSKLDRQLEVADIITSQKIAAGPSWTPVSVPAGCCFFSCFF